MKKIKFMFLVGTILLAMFMFTGCGSTTVDLNKYMTIEVTGYDSRGTAKYTFDRKSFIEDYSDKIKINSKKSSDTASLGLMLGMSPAELLLDSCVKYELDKSKELSNGDVVTLKWNCEDNLAKENFNVKLKYSDIKHKVSELKEVDKFNPFDYVEVSFSGISPNVKVTITPNYEQPEMQYISFSADKDSRLKNGDTITVTALISKSNEEKLAEKFGKIHGVTKKEYTVESLPYYVTKVDEIPSDTMDKIISHGESVFRSYVERKWAKPENLIDVEYIGNYFLVDKNPWWISSYTELYMVYKISAVNPEREQPIEFYYYVCYSDITASADGTCTVNFDDCKVPQDGLFTSESFKVGKYKYMGYETLDALFNNCIVPKINKYEYTSTIKNAEQ